MTAPFPVPFLQGCEVHFHALCAWFKGACMQLKVLDKTYLGDPESGAYPAGPSTHPTSHQRRKDLFTR